MPEDAMQQRHIVRNPVTESLRVQFEACLIMTQDLLDAIPDELWLSLFHGMPVWQQAYHTVYFVDAWLRDYYEKGQKDHLIAKFDERIRYTLDEVVPLELAITREEMQKYLKRIHEKAARVFGEMSDIKLGKKIMMDADRELTHMSVLAGQLRHIMYNIGYLDALLCVKSLPAIEWYDPNGKEKREFDTGRPPK